MKALLITNYNGYDITFIISNITAVTESRDTINECLIYVVGSENACYCSESYKEIIKKIKMALENIED